MMKTFKKFSSIFLIISIVFISFVIAFDIPAHDERVTDQANLFSVEEEAALELQLGELEQAHKAEIAVLTLTSLQGEDISWVSNQIANTWGVGKAEADNGILIVIAPNERERRIEVGYGLEGDVPDITAYHLGKEDLVPAFREGQYYQGVTNLIDHLSGVVAGTYIPELYTQEEDQSLLGDFIMGLFALTFLGLFISLFTRSALDSFNKKPSKKIKKNVFQIGSFLNMLPGLMVVGGWGVLYLLPLWYIWKFFITSKSMEMGGGTSGSSGWSSSSSSSSGGGSSSSGSSFGGFGGGSFGGGGSGGSR